MKKSIKEFEKLLVIDKNNLDLMCVQQPQLFYEVSEAYCSTVSKRDEAKEDVITADAEVACSIREQAEKSGKKITEAFLQQQVSTSKEHFDTMGVYLASKLEVEKLAALKDAFYQRANMIRDLCSLYAANYFSDPSVTSKVDANEARASITRIRMMRKKGQE